MTFTHAFPRLHASTPSNARSGFRGVRALLALLSCAFALTFPRAGGLHAQQPTTTVASPAQAAWDASLTLEARGDVRGARQTLIDAFGADPAAYAPCVRIAWLTYRLGDAAEAVRHYRRARALPGALSEATYGLSLALVSAGYADLARGALGQARAEWTEALTIDASNEEALAGIAIVGPATGVSGDLWLATISASPTGSTSSAQVYYAQLAVRAASDLAFRASVRQVASPSFTGPVPSFASQTEFFVGVAKDVGIATVEGIGMVLSATGRVNAGGAATVRAGGSVGVTAVASVLSRTGGANVQLTPMVFAYLGGRVAVAAGARITSDSAFQAVSPTVALSARGGAFTFDAAAHAGREQWAFNPAGPTVLSIFNITTSGATATLGWQANHRVALFAQAQVEQLDGGGTFQGFSLGLRIGSP